MNVAAVVTVFHHNAHADVIVGRLLEGYHLNGKGSLPSLKLVSLYVDQKPKNDLSRSLAEKHGFRLFDSVEKALTLGSGKLAVDGVLLVAEHGSYPKSETDQVLYPKRRLFAEIVTVFENSKRVVPVFSDKHLADNWNDALWIYETSQKMRIPLMAGSSLPPYRRLPPVDVRRNAELEEIVAVGYGGVESYGFHALEMLQCLAERREGGETGVNSVTCLTGDAVWKAQQDGLFDSVLLNAALEHKRQTNPKRSLRERVKNPALFSIRYNDGLRASVLMLTGATSDFSVAWKYKNGSGGQHKIESTLFAIENDRPFMHFADLLLGIEKMMHTRKPAWPVERTLLTTGILNAAMISQKQSGKRIETPYLKIRYRSDWNWKHPLPQEERFR
ncbi:MAG: hypothetical protein IID46_10465 [Planctomycetes bacterium]|nr:hypothetical protein [Planctomycetota bacterium]